MVTVTQPGVTQPGHKAQRGHAKKDDSQPVEHANPSRNTQHPNHPSLDTHPDIAIRPGPAAPRGTPAWRQANSRSPDTQLPGHEGMFSNGDRRRLKSKAQQHPH